MINFVVFRHLFVVFRVEGGVQPDVADVDGETVVAPGLVFAFAAEMVLIAGGSILFSI